ncbi:MAG: SufE family protein [Deltaproteobacteria bacterium]|nr:SufE family protein [Deltaproteobacteria bacterium]
MEADELIERFELFDQWEDRYRYLIDLGKQLAPLSEAERSPEHKVEGCMSQVWLVADAGDGDPPVVRFRGDSDSHIVRGLIAILLLLCSGRTPRQILDTDIEGIFGQLGLEQHISPNRRNGFFAMVGRIQDHARAAAGQ